MPNVTKKKKTAKTTRATTRRATTVTSSSKQVSPKKDAVPFLGRLNNRLRNFLARRPHRSFRRTYRRDYVRSLQLAGYWSFTRTVWLTLWRHKAVFGLLALIYALATAVLVGVSSQDTYTQLSQVLSQSSGSVFQGSLGVVGKAGLLLVTTLTGGVSATPTQSQQIYSALIALLTWLTTVWLLRNLLAGQVVRLRDGLYTAGAPILPTALVGLVAVVQLLPLALALIAYGAAQLSGLLGSGIAAMLFWIAASLLALVSVYWLTSTVIALVVVTLPGMYPLQAIKVAGDLVIGRRIRILLRLLWMGLVTLIVWAVIMIPLILIDAWFKSVVPAASNIPVVPFAVLVMSALTVVWLASYVYILYRKVVEDDAQPA